MHFTPLNGKTCKFQFVKMWQIFCYMQKLWLKTQQLLIFPDPPSSAPQAATAASVRTLPTCRSKPSGRLCCGCTNSTWPTATSQPSTTPPWSTRHTGPSSDTRGGCSEAARPPEGGECTLLFSDFPTAPPSSFGRMRFNRWFYWICLRLEHRDWCSQCEFLLKHDSMASQQCFFSFLFFHFFLTTTTLMMSVYIRGWSPQLQEKDIYSGTKQNWHPNPLFADYMLFFWYFKCLNFCQRITYFVEIILKALFLTFSVSEWGMKKIKQEFFQVL